jgi:hypothetical protein
VKIVTRLLLLLSLAVLPSATFAQWPDYPSPNVPKTKDGKPDVTGPVPRAADGHPDLTGLWEYFRERPQNRPATPPPAPPAGPGTGFGAVAPRSNSFFNIGISLKDGLPFTPWAADLRKGRMSGNNQDNPDAHCLPIGLMQLHQHPQPRKIIQTPAVTVILYEAQGGVRQIFTDGRPLPKDVEPWWYGYSVGHWDGDTFVVETTGFRDDVWLDVEGSPLTSSGKMTERFKRVDFGHMNIDVTVEDPKAYTKPWTVTIKQRILLNTDLIEFICNENEKDAQHYAK